MPKITEMYAWVLADTGPDDEGVPAVKANIGGNSFALPLVGADMARVQSLRPHAQLVADKAGKPIKLVRCSRIEIVEWVRPKGRLK